MAKKTSTTKKVKEPVIETPIVEEVAVGTPAVEETTEIKEDINDADNKLVTEEPVETTEMVTESVEGNETQDFEEGNAPLIVPETISDIIGKTEVIAIETVDEPISIVKSEPESPIISIPSNEELALQFLRKVENPDERFIQDVCNILKITRLKKVESKPTQKRERKKWGGVTIWKW